MEDLELTQTDEERAIGIIAGERTKREKACEEELYKVLDKFNCTLSPEMIITMQGVSCMLKIISKT